MLILTCVSIMFVNLLTLTNARYEYIVKYVAFSYENKHRTYGMQLFSNSNHRSSFALETNGLYKMFDVIINIATSAFEAKWLSCRCCLLANLTLAY